MIQTDINALYTDPYEISALDNKSVQRLHAVVAELSPDQRDVIACNFFGDMKNKETAEVLGKRVGSVRAIQLRALLKLRDLLNEDRELFT